MRIDTVSRTLSGRRFLSKHGCNQRVIEEMKGDISNLQAVGHQLVAIVGGSPVGLGFTTQDRPLLEHEWDDLIEMAVTNGVVRHVVKWILSQIEISSNTYVLPEYLAQRARWSSLRSIALRAELIRVMRAFEQLDIPVMPLKGPVLADLYHRRPELREFGDLDLLVEESERDRAMELLNAIGYHSPYENHTLSERYHVVFRHRDTDEMVELHWRIANPTYGKYYRGNFLWNHATKRTYRAGVQVWLPSPEATVLYLAIHAYKHEWARLQWLMDIPEVLAVANFDWNRLENLAKENDADRLLRATLQLTWSLFPDCQRPMSTHGLTRSALVSPQISRVRRLMLRPALDRERIGDYLMLSVANAENFRDKARLLWHVVRASDRDRDAVGGKIRLSAPAAIIRPFRLLWRMISGNSRASEKIRSQ